MVISFQSQPLPDQITGRRGVIGFKGEIEKSEPTLYSSLDGSQKSVEFDEEIP
jgi:hypothetical protein